MIINQGTDLVELELEEKVARDSLERYSGSHAGDFQPFVLLTNFPAYVDYFADKHDVPVIQGSMMRVAHAPDLNISMIDFKIGSPAAALAVDLISFLPVQGSLLLGMCGGLRRRYEVGDYFVPVAAIRVDGTSDFYFPPDVPAMANFLVQKVVTDMLDERDINYHIGITHHTNLRFWEFNTELTEHIKATRAQAIEMECATLFVASYKYKLPLGALLMVSDLPLNRHGIKTKESAKFVYETYMADHVDKGVETLTRLSTHPRLKKRLGRAGFFRTQAKNS